MYCFSFATSTLALIQYADHRTVHNQLLQKGHSFIIFTASNAIWDMTGHALVRKSTVDLVRRDWCKFSLIKCFNHTSTVYTMILKTEALGFIDSERTKLAPSEYFGSQTTSRYLGASELTPVKLSLGGRNKNGWCGAQTNLLSRSLYPGRGPRGA